MLLRVNLNVTVCQLVICFWAFMFLTRFDLEANTFDILPKPINFVKN